MSTFDRLRRQMFGTVLKVMADKCVWTPSAGGATLTVKVLYNAPSADYDMKVRSGKALYTISDALGTVTEAFFEYRADDLPGLDRAVKDGRKETVTLTIEKEGVIGDYQYVIRKIENKWDGYNNKALIDPKE